MLNWIKNKILSMNSILDVGVVIGIITSVTTLLIIIYKFTYLKFLGVPFKIVYMIIDVKFIDYVLAVIFYIIAYLLGVIVYYTLYKVTWKNKIKNIFLFLIICILICIVSAFIIGESYLVVLCFCMVCFSLYIFSTIILWLFKERKSEEIEFKFYKNKESKKLMIIIFEGISIFIIMALIPFIFALSMIMLPTDKVFVDNKIIVYEAEDVFLIADYEYVDNAINEYDTLRIINDSFEIVNEENKINVSSKKGVFTRNK